jgi:hypothetical protein
MGRRIALAKKLKSASDGLPVSDPFALRVLTPGV